MTAPTHPDTYAAWLAGLPDAATVAANWNLTKQEVLNLRKRLDPNITFAERRAIGGPVVFSALPDTSAMPGSYIDIHLYGKKPVADDLRSRQILQNQDIVPMERFHAIAESFIHDVFGNRHFDALEFHCRPHKKGDYELETHYVHRDMRSEDSYRADFSQSAGPRHLLVLGSDKTSTLFFRHGFEVTSGRQYRIKPDEVSKKDWITVPDGKMVFFDDLDYHAARPAAVDGYRFFGRADWQAPVFTS